MNAQSDAPARAPTVFAIPETAHEGLVQLRNHLRLMAELTALGTQASNHDTRLRPDALAWNFSRMAKDVEGIVAASWFSTELVEACEAAGKEAKRAKARA